MTSPLFKSPIPLNYLDTDTALTANSDVKVATQKAVKAYVASQVPTALSVASGAEVDTGTDNVKYVTPKAMEDSTYAKTTAIPVKASGAEVDTGTDDAKFVTSKAIADSKLSYTDGAETLTNKTLTSPVIGNITNTDHISLTPGTSKLVKIAVLEQAVTTNTYNNNSVILTGWGYATSAGSARYLDVAVTFGITFSTRPAVVSSGIGHKSGSNPSHIGDFGVDVDVTTLGGISTTGFTIRTYRAFDTSNILNGDRTGFSWIAIGTLT